jgi:hypothetical protein
VTNTSIAGMAAVPRPLKNLFGPMRVALIIYAIGEVGLMVMNVGEYLLLTQQGVDPYMDEGPTGIAFAAGAVGGGLLQLGGLIASIILVCRWTFRAMKNLHLSGVREAEMSPGWAVGWYFIPVANLWKPLEGMLQIWRGSMGLAGRPVKVAAVAGWWWAAWLVSNFLANISVQMTGFMEPGPAYEPGLLVAAVSSGIAMVAAICLIGTAKAVTDAQEAAGSASVAEAFV